MIYLASNIRYLRKKEGISQKDLGEKIGALANTISHYENGITVPGYDKLLLIKNFFHVSTDNLLYLDLASDNNSSENYISFIESSQEYKEAFKQMTEIISVLKNNDAINSKSVKENRNTLYSLQQTFTQLSNEINRLKKELGEI